MASFHTKTFQVHDDYMTPKSAWESIDQYIPKDKVIWECFYGDGKSGEFLKELGCKEVIHKDVDFYENDLGEVIISNPPFSDCKKIMPRLRELDKPFILIMPCSKMNTNYFHEAMMDADPPIQIIIPRSRIQFQKLVDGKPVETKHSCNFDCFYFCYKMNLPRDIVWLQ
jgi:hypothetical protein